MCATNGETGAVNPIFKREFFARWRDWRSHALLLVLVLVLAIAVFWVYRDVMSDAGFSQGAPRGVYSPSTGRYGVPETLSTRAARVGRGLFQGLTLGNVAVFFLLAPLFTATGVVRERERGLLESLQLSRMSSWSQIRARATSALLFLGALQLATIPVVFVAFSFGGISLQEIARAWLLTGVTALVGIGLGIGISSNAARPSGALFGAIALMALWSVLAGYALAASNSPYGMFDLGPEYAPVGLVLCDWHPIGFTARLLYPTIMSPQAYFIGKTIYKTAFWTPTQSLPLVFAFWFALGSLGLWKASRDVARAFAPAGWSNGNPLVERWKKRRETRLERRRAKARVSVEGVLLADLPFDKWIRFKNPLLNREVKSRFRLRRGSAFVWLARFVLFLVGAAAWVYGGAAMFDPVGRSGGAGGVLYIEWLLGVVLVGTFAATGLAREREAGTWEGVRLSLLSDGEIARTKWLSPLITFGLLSSPLWLLLFGYLPVGAWQGTPVRVMFCQVLVIASSLALVSAIAGWMSLRAKSTTTATCWTLGILLFLLGVAPIVWNAFDTEGLIAAAVVGVPPPEADYMGSFSNYDPNAVQCAQNPDCRALYERETHQSLSSAALKAISAYTHNASDKPFFDWLTIKEAQAQKIADVTQLWNPQWVLYVIADRKGGDDTDPHLKHRDTNTVIDYSLVHASLCALCSALLLGLVTRQLKRQRD